MARTIKIKMDKEESEDKKLSIALMSAFVILTIQYFVLISYKLLGTATSSKVQLLSKVLVGIMFLYALPVVFKRSKIKLINTYFIVLFVFILHYLVFPANRIYLKELVFPLFFMCLPAFIYSMSLNDYTMFKQVMKKASMIVFVIGAALGGLILSGRSSAGTYSMSLSYYMLLPTIMFLDELLERFSIKLLLFTSISLLVILALGSRGAVLCIIVFVFLKFIRLNIRFYYQKFLANFSIFCAGLLGFAFLDRILKVLNNILMGFGIRSRSISLFLKGEIYLSGRHKIYRVLIDKISENPILGIGIGGDRQVIGGGYAHNIFLELLADFGVIVGSLVGVAILIFIVIALFIKDQEKRNMMIIWTSLGFVHLMVSSSYLTDMKFAILMGLVTKGIMEKNHSRTNRNNTLKNTRHVKEGDIPYGTIG
jgi:hypothetical protein